MFSLRKNTRKAPPAPPTPPQEPLVFGKRRREKQEMMLLVSDWTTSLYRQRCLADVATTLVGPPAHCHTG